MKKKKDHDKLINLKKWNGKATVALLKSQEHFLLSIITYFFIFANVEELVMS